MNRYDDATSHRINSWGDCSCGQDGATCQVCGGRMCGNHAAWVNVGVLTGEPGRDFMGNVCPACFDRLRKD